MPSNAPSREQLLYTLHEAAEIEHNLMCCYLYAAFSLKLADARRSAEEAAAVARWRNVIVGVAMEEMAHLALVANLVHAIGGQAHFGRPVFPIESGPYPAGFVIRLQPFSPDTVAHFQFLERAHDAAIADGPGYAPQASYRRQTPQSRLSPGAQDYRTVGDLYTSLRAGLTAFCEERGQAALFIGAPALQVDAQLAPLPGLRAVTDLAGAMAALDTIVVQGEGAGVEEHDSHYCRFNRMAGELNHRLRANPGFEPAWPAATNPVMNPPPTPDGKVHVDHPINARWLDVGNAMYATSLRCLLQGFGATDRAAKARWLSASYALMHALVPVGHGMAARPAHDDGRTGNAGLTFTSLRTLALLPETTAATVIGQRLIELRMRAAELPVALVEGESASTWPGVIAALDAQARRILGDAVADRIAPAASAVKPLAPASAPTPAPAIEHAKGRAVSIAFDSARCIHARHCVLQTPTVFKANTAGEWIYPDTVSAETLVAVAEQCPSGAIQYERHDGGPAESAPPVNLVRLRENGPYAVHAPLVIAGRSDGFRATLCRCGQSQRKPYCDGSHNAAGFSASGEPATRPNEALAVRDGPLEITPLRNGPLKVCGNLELLAGTGRTVAKLGAPNTGEARLCRCGHSANKPFCDGSHIAAGFVAEGA